MDNKLYLLDVTCLENEELFKTRYDMMGQMRKNKIDALKPSKAKRLSLGAGILLKQAMEEQGIYDFEVIVKEHEKPYIKDRSDVFFNISHSGSLVAIGVSDKEIGIDIEEIMHFKDTLARYVFCENELSLAKELSEKEGPDTTESGNEQSDILPVDIIYTRFWTHKESIMKHSGLGITLEPKKIELYSEKGALKARAEGYDCRDLKLFSYKEKNCQISVCTEYDSFPDVSYVVL